MNAENSSREKINLKRVIILKTILTLLYIFLTILLYNVLIELETNYIIIFLIIFFTFLVFIGFIIKRKDQSLLSKLFPRLKEISEYKKKSTEKRKPKSNYNINSFNIDFKYHKPIIRKCNNCGMIVPSFAKKCPVCGEDII
ncbi:MAG: hypothetical protein ACTSPD_00375 [Promethearchaeota archaeon]